MKNKEEQMAHNGLNGFTQKQTAVQWLFKEIKHIIPDTFLNKFEQAKEMEKQQIIDAYRFPNTLVDMSSEQYYNETFKSK